MATPLKPWERPGGGGSATGGPPAFTRAADEERLKQNERNLTLKPAVPPRPNPAINTGLHYIVKLSHTAKVSMLSIIKQKMDPFPLPSTMLPEQQGVCY